MVLAAHLHPDLDQTVQSPARPGLCCSPGPAAHLVVRIPDQRALRRPPCCFGCFFFYASARRDYRRRSAPCCPPSFWTPRSLFQNVASRVLLSSAGTRDFPLSFSLRTSLRAAALLRWSSFMGLSDAHGWTHRSSLQKQIFIKPLAPPPRLTLCSYHKGKIYISLFTFYYTRRRRRSCTPPHRVLVSLATATVPDVCDLTRCFFCAPVLAPSFRRLRLFSGGRTSIPPPPVRPVNASLPSRPPGQNPAPAVWSPPSRSCCRRRTPAACPTRGFARPRPLRTNRRVSMQRRAGRGARGRS